MTSIQSNTEYDYNTTTIQMGFRRKSNDLFESVSLLLELLTRDRRAASLRLTAGGITVLCP